MDRIEMVQEYVDDILQSTVNETERKCGYKHLYGVSQACAVLAMKRNEDVELAVIAGILHDIYTYKTLAHAAEHEKDRFRMLKEELGLI